MNFKSVFPFGEVPLPFPHGMVGFQFQVPRFGGIICSLQSSFSGNLVSNGLFPGEPFLSSPICWAGFIPGPLHLHHFYGVVCTLFSMPFPSFFHCWVLALLYLFLLPLLRWLVFNSRSQGLVGSFVPFNPLFSGNLVSKGLFPNEPFLSSPICWAGLIQGPLHLHHFYGVVCTLFSRPFPSSFHCWVLALLYLFLLPLLQEHSHGAKSPS